MIYLANSFSLNMLGALDDFKMRISKMSIEAVSSWLCWYDWESFVGHEDTAKLFSNLLGLQVEYRRGTLLLAVNDSLIVGQYSGLRLPEGATELPEGSKITWYGISSCD